MSSTAQSRQSTLQHPYLSGNFAPVSKTCSPTPVTWTGGIPDELHGGMYVRNGGNPVTNADLGREAHWFDGDGMLSGVWFDRSALDPRRPVVNFVNQFILTDVFLAAVENSSLQTPILPSIATLVNPVSRLLYIIWRILRSIIIVLLSHLPGSRQAVTRISVANTGIHFHDGRALATCESGPPMRVTLPELETVGWFDGISVQGEPTMQEPQAKGKQRELGFGGTGPLSWMREWTTGHPKVDSETGELVLFHCNFAPPYVHYSLVPTTTSYADTATSSMKALLNAPVPGCSGGKLMHDFGVSRHHTVILDLPLTLSPFNLAMNKPVLSYESQKPARFGLFPRRHPELVRWFETSSCCIFHTANTWDEWDSCGNIVAVNLLACRLTSASLVFSAANIPPPPHPRHQDSARQGPMSFFAPYDDEHFLDPEKMSLDETSPLLGNASSSRRKIAPQPHINPAGVPISIDEQEQCRLYYYRFSLCTESQNIISHEFALSAIPFEFPTVSPLTDMKDARYIYGCSTAIESFGAALGKATKIDVLVRVDVKTLLARAELSKPDTITGCVDTRTVEQILASRDSHDPIKAFRLPAGYYAQEAQFVPCHPAPDADDAPLPEENGYLLFYVFDESQLDASGACRADAKSEMWVLDARSMQTVVCRIHLPTRIPYGLHGKWFTEQQITCQRAVASLRQGCSGEESTSTWARIRRRLVGQLG